MTETNRSQESIEDIILWHDERGMTALRPHLPPDYCVQAARFIYERPGTVLVVTGFYEIEPHTIETDGPPGALAVGRALQDCDRDVVYISDKYAVPFLEPEAQGADVVEFPITRAEESRAFALSLLDRYRPSVVMALERCSVTQSGRYLNMSGKDITAYTARVDYLFTEHSATVGVGDGGNEIGMGKLAHVIPTVPSLPDKPALTSATHLVVTSVSNWGGYGLAAGLSILASRDLLPSREEEAGLIRRMVDRGAVDGKLMKSVPGVDGYTLEENLDILDRLRHLVAASM
jgi:hypothetical protein